jgi:hypothetical protein
MPKIISNSSALHVVIVSNPTEICIPAFQKFEKFQTIQFCMPETKEHEKHLAGELFKNTLLTVEVNIKWDGQMIRDSEADTKAIKANFKVLSWHFPERRKSQETCYSSHHLNPDSNWVPTEYKSSEILLCQPVQYRCLVML